MFSPDRLAECTVTDSPGSTDLYPNFDSFMHLIGRDATFVCMYAALQNFRSEALLDFESIYANPPIQAIVERRENIHVSLKTLATLNFEEQFILTCVPIRQDFNETHAIMLSALSLFQWAIRTPKSYLYVIQKCESELFYSELSQRILLLKYLFNLVHYRAPHQMKERDRAALELRIHDYYNIFTDDTIWDLQDVYQIPHEEAVGADLEADSDVDTPLCASAITLNSDVSKLDFIRVLYVLYELDFFVKESGKKVTKKELFAFLATWLGKETLAHYDKDMTNSWKSDMSAHIAIFDTMRSKMVELATNKNVANYKKIE